MVNQVISVDEQADRVTVTINRPAARNAINQQVRDELSAVIDDLERNPRFLLVTGGQEGIFAAGADIGELRERSRIETLRGPTARLFDRLASLPMPTIAAIDGPALGGGAELALACDLRIGSERVRLGFPEPGLGAVAGAGGCYRLVAAVGTSVASQMLLGGRQLGADEATALGLLLSIVPSAELIESANTFIDRMAKNSAMALTLTKTALRSPADSHPTVDLLAQAMMVGDSDREARMARFFERSASKSKRTDTSRR